MMHRTRTSPPRRASSRRVATWQRLGLLALLLTGGGMLFGCGTGESTPETPAFEFKALGPNGGTIAAGDVQVVIPPGALSELIRVSILPQSEPFPVAGDPLCTYAFLGPLWCVGPVGHELLVDAEICVDYDPSLIPPGVDPSELILLIWDEDIQSLVPEPGATHDMVANQFCYASYGELGHVAIAIETCVEPPDPMQLFVAGWNDNTLKPNLPNAQQQNLDGIYVGDVEDFVAPERRLGTNGELPDVFLPSVDGSTLMYSLSFFTGGEFSAANLFTTPTDEFAPPGPTPLGPFGNTVATDANTMGWWAESGGSADVFFTRLPELFKPTTGSTALVSDDRDVETTEVVPADDSAAPAPFHAGLLTEGAADFLQDIRQSPTGLHVLYEYSRFDGESSNPVIEIVSTAVASPAVGGPLVSSGAVSPGGGLFTPRFTPDGTRVYSVANDAQSVVSSDLTGGDDQTIFTIGQASQLPLGSNILDYVIAPDGTHVFVLIDASGGQTSGGTDVMLLGTLAGNATTVLDQVNRPPAPFSSRFYREIIWNPIHLAVYLSEPFDGGVTPVLLDPAAPTGLRIVEQTPLPVGSNFGIGAVDASTEDGRLLVTIFNLNDDPVFDQRGVWLTDHLGQNAQAFPDPLGTAIDSPARWLASWRLAPGTFGGGVR